jgi:acyl-CoA synthetase (AMP-forming)/AMP-acid ligase II
VSGGLKAAPPVIHNFQTSALEQNKVAVAPIKNESTRTLVGCGQTLAGQKIIIVDPESLTRCPPDQVGEIWVSGPSVAQGYWNQPTETERAFRACLADTKEGPFLRTGDFGFLMNGELFVTGRLKDLIIIDGSNHYPQDIERTVEGCHPAIRPNGCAAFSIEGSGGEQLVVCAEVERGYLSKRYKGVGNGFNLQGRQPTEVEALTRTIRRAVAEHHDLQVHDVRLLKPGSIPKTSSGKIQRHACRADYLGGTLDVLEE